MEELRIVLLGKQGSGKSSTGNTLLGKQAFHTESSSQGITQACSMSINTVDGKKISVVDTPGWTDQFMMEEETVLEITKCIDHLNLGPHVFLLVLQIGRFTKEEINTVQQILEVFGEDAKNYTIVLFTRGDDLKKKTIEEYLEGVHPELKKILDVCGQRYHVLNNRDNENRIQISTLLEKINLMAKQNKGKHYSKDMYQKMADKMGKTLELQKTIKTFINDEYREQINSQKDSNDGSIIKKHTETDETVSNPISQVRESLQMPVDGSAANSEYHSKALDNTESEERGQIDPEIKRCIQEEVEKMGLKIEKKIEELLTRLPK